jgi:hypothetical protein
MNNKKTWSSAKAKVTGTIPKFDPLNFVGVICKHSSVISLTETCIYIYMYKSLSECHYFPEKGFSEELRWQAASVINFEKFLSSKGHNSHQM